MKKWRWKRIVLYRIGGICFPGDRIHGAYLCGDQASYRRFGTRIIARIDIHQPIARADVEPDHRLVVSAGSESIMYSSIRSRPLRSSPMRRCRMMASQDRRRNLGASLPYSKAERVMPPQGTTRGCPVAATSMTYRVYTFMKTCYLAANLGAKPSPFYEQI